MITCVRKCSFWYFAAETRWPQFAYHFQILFFFKRLKKQFVPNGAVNYKSKLVQAMAWYREDNKPLPESLVIQANGAYMSLSDWLSWLLHRIGKIYPRGEKRYSLSTRWMLSPPYLKVGNSDPSGRVGARDGLTIFCKIPISATPFGSWSRLDVGGVLHGVLLVKC